MKLICKQQMQKWAVEVFIDGLSGMALGLFSTLIMGTILGQLAAAIGGVVGDALLSVSAVAKTLTGAGIGVGVAAKLKQSPLVTVSAAVVGMLGAFPSVTGVESLVMGRPGEPLGAFVGAIAAVKIGGMVSGKTKLDIILTPLVSILSGAVVAFLIGPPITKLMTWLGYLVNINVERYPILGGALVAVFMGMILTLPISSAAVGVSLGMSGLAAGAATVGCCCNMIGFAVISYKENGLGGFFAQGIGTSMLQMPNIIRKPIIWLPSIISSALLGPLSSALLGMTSTPVGSGMGTAGLVGPIACYGSMTADGNSSLITLSLILAMHFVLPALLTWAVALVLRRYKLISYGDMKLVV